MNKEPWKSHPEIWKTQADFYNYIRGGLRKAVWARHPVKIAYLQKMRFKAPLGKPTAKNPEGMVWACKCELCGEVFRQSDCEVDHLDPAGSLRSEEDLQEFITKLAFVDFDDIRILDKGCHRAVSYAERMGISVEEASVEKEKIAFFKDHSVAEQKEILKKWGAKDGELNNDKNRKTAYSRYKKAPNP